MTGIKIDNMWLSYYNTNKLNLEIVIQMTTQLLILGNGFDLQCGLKSGYKDFFRAAILDITGKDFGLQQLKNDVSGCWEYLLLLYYKTYGEENYDLCDI